MHPSGVKNLGLSPKIESRNSKRDAWNRIEILNMRRRLVVENRFYLFFLFEDEIQNQFCVVTKAHLLWNSLT